MPTRPSCVSLIAVGVILNLHERTIAFNGLKAKHPTAAFRRSHTPHTSSNFATFQRHDRTATDSYVSSSIPAGMASGDDGTSQAKKIGTRGKERQERPKERRVLTNILRRRKVGENQGSDSLVTAIKTNKENVPARWRRFPLRRLRLIGNGVATLGDERTTEKASTPMDRAETKQQGTINQGEEVTSRDPSEYPSSPSMTSLLSTPSPKQYATRAALEENENDDSFQNVANDLTVEMLSLEAPNSDEDDDDADIAENKGRGKRVTFSASKECKRMLSTNEKYRSLLDEYMMLPLEQYSVKSFHDGGPKKTTSRRWLVRRLSEEESLQYRLQYYLRDNHEDYMGDSRNTGCVENDDKERDRFFRLAVPLMPLIGLELTPVIDLEVIPASSPLSTEESSGTTSATSSPCVKGEPDKKKNPFSRVFRRGALRRIRREFTSGDPGAVRMQSRRVALLSTEDEVQNLMRESRNPRPTAVSRNPSVRQIGNEAIGVVGKIEEWIQPHISFDATITWNAGHDESRPQLGADEKAKRRRRKDKKIGPSVTVKSTAVTSLTIPPLPVSMPLPSRLLVKKIGSTLTKRALDIALPRFLGQLERDFERWANIDEHRK